MAPQHLQRRVVPGAAVPDGWTRAVVPPVPDGKRRGSWRRAVTGTRAGERGLDAMPGTRLRPGDEVALPPGTLVLAVDKAKTGTAFGRYGRYITEDADCTALLLLGDGTWQPVWSRFFKTSSSATGLSVVKRLAKLLVAHPAPGGDPVVLVEVQVPNRAWAGSCRLCARPVAARAGHLFEGGRNPVVEHWPHCPPEGAPDPEPPATCDECDGPGRSHERTDSSGITGWVCARCNRDPDYLLSFA